MKIRFNKKFLICALFPLVLLYGVLWTPVQAKTRWSSLHFVPDADFLAGGQIVTDIEGYTFGDSAQGQTIRPTCLLNLGVMEWVNLETGYAGGFTLGFKARLLGENGGYLPSVAVGARDIISSKESNYFNSKDTLTNAFYCVLAKSFDPLRLRIHAGIQTIPTSKDDQVDPFFALEEYCGAGLYVSLEIERLKKAFWPSLFASLRVLNKKLELSAGAVGLNRLFFDKNNKFNFSLSSTDSSGFVRPGIWVGLRFKGNIPTGKSSTFASIDDNVKAQAANIDQMKQEIDSLKTMLSENMTRMAKVDNSILMLSDSIYSDRNRLKSVLFDKLVALKILYETEPFEPEQARQSILRIVAIKEKALPILKEYLLDKKQDRKIRMLCISLIGEMGGTGASDALLDVLSQSEDPDIKIEILIALGKMKETRALYVMEQLANDPIDVVAFTAQEVLQKLVRENGIKLSTDFKMRPVTMSETSIIKEEKIPIAKTAAPKSGKGNDSLGKGDRKDAISGKVKPSVIDSINRKGPQVKGTVPDSAHTVKDSTKVKIGEKPSLPGLSDTAGTIKKDNQPARGAVSADSVSPTAAEQVNKDVKAPLPPAAKKGKEPKKKKSSASPAPEDKNW